MDILRKAKLNHKGQASVTDALFFLLIVAGLSALLFMFNVSYGQNVELQLARQSNSDYAQSALKTILYSSVPRNPEETLDETDEIDYLMTVVKEDFADDGAIGEMSQKILVQNISRIMLPLSSTFDYIFSIYVLPQSLHPKGEYAFVMLSKSEIETGGDRAEVTGIKTYLCNPPTLGEQVPLTDELGVPSVDDYGNPLTLLVKEDAIDKLLVKVGETAQSNARMDLVQLTASGQERIPAQVNFTMWVSTKIQEDFVTQPQGLNCAEFTG